jgi:hypothetical protein
MSEEVTGSSFLGSSGNYFLPESRSVAFSVDEDPWSSAGFEPVQDLRTSITQTIDDDIVTDGLTAANVLGIIY